MTADDFRDELAALFEAASEAGRGAIVVRADDLHRGVGGYPGADHRMPLCCNVMHAEMVVGVDEVLSAREGPALLQGLAICGVCGRRMTVRYHTRKGRRGGRLPLLPREREHG